MMGSETAVLIRKIGMVFASYTAAVAFMSGKQGWEVALMLAAAYIASGLLLPSVRITAARIHFAITLSVCIGFLVIQAPYSSILFHILLLTAALELGRTIMKRAAVTILLVYTGIAVYAAPAYNTAFWAAVAFNIIGFYALTYVIAHLQKMVDKKNTDATKMMDLIQQNNQNYRMALTDGLTGLYNYRAYRDKIDTIDQYVLLVIDIDHFKRLNDTYGHAIGDKVLIKLGNIIKLSVRHGDLAFRYGGEEFVIVLPGATQQLGLSIAERLRARIAQSDFIFGTAKIPVTISVGLSVKTPSVTSSRVFEQADQALYKAKQQGRNNVQCCAVKLEDSRYKAN